VTVSKCNPCVHLRQRLDQAATPTVTDVLAEYT